MAAAHRGPQPPRRLFRRGRLATSASESASSGISEHFPRCRAHECSHRLLGVPFSPCDDWGGRHRCPPGRWMSGPPGGSQRGAKSSSAGAEKDHFASNACGSSLNPIPALTDARMQALHDRCPSVREHPTSSGDPAPFPFGVTGSLGSRCQRVSSYKAAWARLGCTLAPDLPPLGAPHRHPIEPTLPWPQSLSGVGTGHKHACVGTCPERCPLSSCHHLLIALAQTSNLLCCARCHTQLISHDPPGFAAAPLLVSTDLLGCEHERVYRRGLRVARGASHGDRAAGSC